MERRHPSASREGGVSPWEAIGWLIFVIILWGFMITVRNDLSRD